MDYFLTEDKSYMPPIPNEFPIDPNNWKACIRGTGNQVQSFSSGRDVAKALIMLLGAPEWVRTVLVSVLMSNFLHLLGAYNLHHWPMVKF